MDNKNSYTYRHYRNNRAAIKISIIIIAIIALLLLPRLVSIKNEWLAAIIILLFVLFLKSIDRQSSSALRHNYMTWGRGAGAELKEGWSLEKLGLDYKIINDIQTGQGNIDHLCIGPTGIFVIETKAHTGTVSYTDRLLINGAEPEKDFLSQVHSEVNYVRDLLRQKFSRDYAVVGILEFTNTRQIDKSIYGPKHGIWIGGTGFANYVIKHKGAPLNKEEIDNIFNIFNKRVAI